MIRTKNTSKTKKRRSKSSCAPPRKKRQTEKTKTGPVTVCCYAFIERWNNRDNAIRFYAEAIVATEGAERDRYVAVMEDLVSGKDICTDGCSNYELCQKEKRFLRFRSENTTQTRDFGGRTWDPVF